ncbi:hypothetical protein EJ08DRAFT_696866 [Tothia fuscella]|uniref:Endo-1,3(4)-beta-glucanase 1 carbohydrate binding domain-containing protein n=1 Tax=Tothia fuscella TaxID=1048955 RepID=A0A9P4NT15_9PEZI|nr:hypothetical protein EJ08DRAFT_696866 [Tothia fuscella]
MQIFHVLAIAAPFAFAAPLEALDWCNGQRYDATQYACYDNKLLCPFFNGAPLSACGDGCYYPYVYNCTQDNQLNVLPEADGLFSLIAVNPAKLVSSKIEACGRAFYLKSDGPCTYCPSQVPQQGGKCPDGKETIIGGLGLVSVHCVLSSRTDRNLCQNTAVPGGQLIYVDPETGALGFTQAHSASKPQGALQDIREFKNGAFILASSWGWLACPSKQQGSAPALLQVVAKLPGLSYASECFDISVLTVEKTGGGFAAWQYT